MTDPAAGSTDSDNVPPIISADEFREQFGEDLNSTLDLGTWQFRRAVKAYLRLRCMLRDRAGVGRR